MAERIEVIAPAGLRCPKESCGSGFIENTPVFVPLTRYYKRLLFEGSLLPYIKPDTKKKKAEVTNDSK
jgi:hypothetical protein